MHAIPSIQNDNNSRKKAKPRTTSDKGEKKVKEKRQSMTWAKKLKRVFNIDIEICEACQGQVRVIACIEEPWSSRKFQIT
tara:strand:- start:326 stop:565 length:240 start_codon:yes stop_codon:yes gene_type:complete